MNQEYVLASGNKGKLREITGMLGPLGFVVRPQSDWKVPEAEENAGTFVENSLIKARQSARYTGLPSIADDSGLVVPALNGAPGIYSARYAGKNAGSEANMSRLLDELRGRAEGDRRAYFYCAMVLLLSEDDPAPLIATACWHGRILEAQQGDGGFGYDPLFGVTGNTGSGLIRSAAQLSAAEKDSVSHRGQALKALVRQLQQRESELVCGLA